MLDRQRGGIDLLAVIGRDLRGQVTAQLLKRFPAASGFRRLASLWCGRCGNRWPQSRATSARNAASLRRPSRWRTCAMASSSASLEDGAGSGRGGIALMRSAIRSSIST